MTRSTLRDLSWPLRTGLMVYPGDPEVRMAPALSLEHDGVAVTSMRLGSHSGTHIDAPSHTIPGGRTTSGIGLEELCGPALVLALPAPAGAVIDARTLVPMLPERVPGIVFLAFGWDRHFGAPAALEHPALGADAARLLLDRGMRVLGTDALSPDPTGRAAEVFPVHAQVLGEDGIIVENLRGLTALGAGTHEVGIFPLSLTDADGAPARVVAFS